MPYENARRQDTPCASGSAMSGAMRKGSEAISTSR